MISGLMVAAAIIPVACDSLFVLRQLGPSGIQWPDRVDRTYPIFIGFGAISNKSMLRRRSLARLSSIDSYCLAGFGQGEGSAYKPWLRVQDIPSLGRVHRIKGWKHGRVHH
ncbi:MAG TPA: hypothetical protein VFY40_00325, partial [Blastocatellia bacterium]|nr:hypothetical protein [Blastocatellia bacterium]